MGSWIRMYKIIAYLFRHGDECRKEEDLLFPLGCKIFQVERRKQKKFLSQSAVVIARD